MTSTARDPIAALCRVVMHRFADATARAGTDSPFARARVRLGARFYDVAAASMRRRVTATLTEHREAVLRDLDAAGELGAVTVVVGIVADAIADVIREGGEEPVVVSSVEDLGAA